MTPRKSYGLLTVNVERIRHDELEEWRSRGQRHPVLISDLIKGTYLAGIESITQFREELGAQQITSRSNYLDTNRRTIEHYISGRKLAIADYRSETVDHFFDSVGMDPVDRQITESPTPDYLLSDIDLSCLDVDRIVGGYPDRSDSRLAGVAGSLMFFAPRGSASDMHTDWDGRDVFLYQAFGCKEIFILPPAASPFLDPIDIYSAIDWRKMDRGRLRGIIESVGGWHVTINSGDTVYIPRFYWHHVDYRTDALSFSFRIDGPIEKEIRFLIDRLHRNYRVQMLLEVLMRMEDRHHAIQISSELGFALRQPYRSARHKFLALEQLVEARLGLLNIDAGAGSYRWVPEDEIVRSLALLWYSEPDVDWSLSRKLLWLKLESARHLIRRGCIRIARSV